MSLSGFEPESIGGFLKAEADCTVQVMLQALKQQLTNSIYKLFLIFQYFSNVFPIYL